MQIIVQMYLRGWDSIKLAQESGINYTSLRRKLRGKDEIYLSEAKAIQRALNCGMSMDELFAERKEA